MILRKKKKELLRKHNAQKIILYAPTFSPSLTSALIFKNKIKEIATSDRLVLIKFHDLMDPPILEEYKSLEKDSSNVQIVKDNNITKYLILSDLLISDTSSVVYEFLLLNKPVITFNSKSEHIKWLNITDPDKLIAAINGTFIYDAYSNERKWIIENYHPYTDGLSSKRIIEELIDYLRQHPVPEKRKISWIRKRKMIKMFGKLN